MTTNVVRVIAVAAAVLAGCNYKYPGDVGTDAGIDAPTTCPNGMLDDGEQCEGAFLNGANCFSEGRIEGELACTANCTFDYSGCYDCGNSAIEGPEVCDSAMLAGATCESRGFDGGTLGCSPDCLSFNETACTDCGNNMREGDEECDGTDLASATCMTLGFAGGSLSCSSCSFNTSACDANLPTVPKLRLPTNDSYQGSINVGGTLRPTFTWEASTWSGAGTVMYEVQYSADQTFVIGTVTVPTASTNHRPAADLSVRQVAPVGTRYFWRVRACVGAACSAYSAVWKVNLGRSDRDVNGDGFADLIVGATGSDAGGDAAGRVYLYLGGQGSTLDPTADATLTGEAAQNVFGNAVAILGDVNGDGFADIGVGATGNSAGGSQAGRAYVYFGGTGNLDATADGVMTGANVMDALGTSVSGAGDLNGDGYADVVVGAPQTAAASGRVYVYFGGPGTTFDTGIDATLQGQANGNAFGYSVTGAGDTNGDGYHDVIAGAYGFGSMAGRAYVFLGGPGAFDTNADSMFTGSTANDTLGLSVSTAGDVNGDGFADVIVGAEGNDVGGSYAGAAYVFFGSASDTIDATADGTMYGPATGDAFGDCVATAGDVNGDGFADVIVGAFFTDAMAGVFNSGRAYVFYGGAGTTFDTASDGTLNGVNITDDNFGLSVASAGDVNGDGFADVVAGAPGVDTAAANAGRIFVFFGSAGTSLNTIFDGSPSGAAAGDGFGRDVH